MTRQTYRVTAWCDRAFYTSFDVTADSPEHALALAKQRAHDHPAEACDDVYAWDQYLVSDDEDNELLTYHERPDPVPAKTVRLLRALEGCLYALDENIDGYGPSKEKAIATARAILARAGR